MSVVIEIEAGIAAITLDWPTRGNALGPDEARELRLAFEGLGDASSARPDISVVVLAANGKSFCAGGDLKAISELVKGGETAVRGAVYTEFQGLFRAVRACPFPLIAAVDGAAVGLGADLALASDTVFVGPNGWFRQGWLAIGAIPATGGLLDLQRRAGRDAVWRYAAADRVGQAEAQEMRLGTAVPDARVAALALAQRLASQARDALLAMKHLTGIADPARHLETALDYQVGLLTDPRFAALAARLLDRSTARS